MPVDRPALRPSKRKLIATVPLAAVGALVFAALALAAFHTVNNTYHGIGSSNGGGVGSGQPYAYASTGLFEVHHQAAMHHVQDDGTHNLQCNTGGQRYNALCYGDWGTAPCQKRAYNQSYVIGAGQQLPWHWMRGASCAGQTHQ